MNFKYTIIHRNDQYELDDQFSDWLTASSFAEARKQINKVYPMELGYTCTSLSIDKNKWD